MGNASYRQTTGNQGNLAYQDPRNFFQTDLPKFIYQQKIGNGKFMKTYVMRVDSTPLVVKVYMRLAEEDLHLEIANLTILWKTLSPTKYPNLLPYQLWLSSATGSRYTNYVTPTPCYLVRQFFHSNLYDRFSTRPFLNELEKLWIMFQLFKCLEICHEHGITHGDLKPENVMCTTGGWVVLTDFSPFKPTLIPDDDPTDYQYYFDCMGRHRCYVAPERFLSRVDHSGKPGPEMRGVWSARKEEPFGTSNTSAEGDSSGRTSSRRFSAFIGGVSSTSRNNASRLLPSMDVFSLGCVMAEVFLDGVPFMDLPAMLRYVSSTTNHMKALTENTGEFDVPELTADHTVATTDEVMPPRPPTSPLQPIGSTSSIVAERPQSQFSKLDDEGSPARALLMRIKNPFIRKVVIDMTQRDPAKRLSVSEYLDILQGKNGTIESDLGISPIQNPESVSDETVEVDNSHICAFPPYFNSCLYPLFLKMHWNGVTPDDRIDLLCQNYEEIVISITGSSDDVGTAFFTSDAVMAMNSGRYFSSSLNPSEDERESLAILKGGYKEKQKLYYGRPAERTRKCFDALAIQRARARPLDGVHDVPCESDQTDEAHSTTSSFFLSQTGLQTEELMRAAEKLLVDISADIWSVEAQLLKHEQQYHNDGRKLQMCQDAIPISTFADTKCNCLSDEYILSHPDRTNETRILSEDPAMKAAVHNGCPAESEDIKIGSEFLRNGDGETVRQRHKTQGFTLVINILCSNFRHLKHPHSKIICILLLARMGVMSPDSVILQRIGPVLLVGLEDQNSVVRAMSIRALRTVLAVVSSFTGMESNYFPMFIFPTLSRMTKDPEIVVREAFAESIGTIAQTAKRFLDIDHLNVMRKSCSMAAAASTELEGQAIYNVRPVESSGSLLSVGGGKGSQTPLSPVPANSTNISSVIPFPYDHKLDGLKEHVSKWIRELIIETSASVNGVRSAFGNASSGGMGQTTIYANCGSSIVKRALLMDIMRLCTFFGEEATMDRLLTQLLTFLNDQDWELRHAFCAKMPSVCAFLGPTVTSECILPCIENAIYDVEEKVVLCAIHSLVSLIEMQLLSKYFIVDFAKKVKPLLLHPSSSLREGAIKFLGGAAAALGSVDGAVFLIPELQDSLVINVSGIEISVELLRNSLLDPLDRKSYREALFERLTDMAQFYRKNFDGQSNEHNLGGNNDIQDSVSHPLRSVAPQNGSSDYDINSDIAIKLKIVEPYLNLAAREINTKTMQWRNGIASGQHDKFGGNSPDRRTTGKPNSVDVSLTGGDYNIVPVHALRSGIISLKEAVAQSDPLRSILDWTAHAMLEHSVQVLLVPHQKFGLLSTRALPDDILLQNIYMDGDGLKNSSKLKLLYGISMRQSDVARVLTPAATPLPSGSTSSSEFFSETGTGHGSWAAASGLATIGQLPTSAQSSQNYAAVNSGVHLDAEAHNNKGAVRHSTQYFGLQRNNMVVLKTLSPAYSECVSLLRRIKALRIPPVAPYTGNLMQPTPDNRAYSSYYEGLDTSVSFDYSANSRSIWRPREGVLLTTLREHSGAVNRLCVSPDQSFFASASADGTVKIWQTRNIDRTAFSRSSATYDKHKKSVIDLAPIENSHSLASVSIDGNIHVWRVDIAVCATSSTGSQEMHSSAGSNAIVDEEIKSQTGYLGVRGTTQLRAINPKEGAAVCVHHYNSDICSMVTYATQCGGVHGWDLRAAQEAMFLQVRPELGHVTSMTLSPDRNWICAGTSAGYISLWDIRYNVACKLWRHSSHGAIHRLACCRSPRVSADSSSQGGSFQSAGLMPQTEGAYLFVAAGNNEAAVWGIPEGGECFKCFRTVPLETSRGPAASLPHLREVDLPRHPYAPLRYHQGGGYGNASTNHSVRAIIGRISQSNLSYLVTAGTDRSIRFWDFSAPTKCYTVSGMEAAQPKGIYDAPKLNDGCMGKLFVCYVASTPSSEKILQAHLPLREGRGIVSANSTARDAILDLKNLDLPMRLLLSGGRDGEVKLWR